MRKDQKCTRPRLEEAKCPQFSSVCLRNINCRWTYSFGFCGPVWYFLSMSAFLNCILDKILILSSAILLFVPFIQKCPHFLLKLSLNKDHRFASFLMSTFVIVSSPSLISFPTLFKYQNYFCTRFEGSHIFLSLLSWLFLPRLRSPSPQNCPPTRFAGSHLFSCLLLWSFPPRLRSPSPQIVLD